MTTIFAAGDKVYLAEDKTQEVFTVNKINDDYSLRLHNADNLFVGNVFGAALVKVADSTLQSDYGVSIVLNDTPHNDLGDRKLPTITVSAVSQEAANRLVFKMLKAITEPDVSFRTESA